MRYMNDYDIHRAGQRYVSNPALIQAVEQIAILRNWTNANSDGWAYWLPPRKSAQKLIALIEGDGTNRYTDEALRTVTFADVRRALTPIKSFRTKHGADFEIVEV